MGGLPTCPLFEKGEGGVSDAVHVFGEAVPMGKTYGKSPFMFFIWQKFKFAMYTVLWSVQV